MRVLTAIDRGELEGLHERDEFYWLDLMSPADADVALLGEIYGFHHLALEDTRKFGQRPKLDDYGDYVLLVAYGARQADDELTLLEAHLFVSGGYIVTTHRERIPELDALRTRFATLEGRSEQFVVYSVVDTLTDTFVPVLGAVDDQIDELENAVIEQPTDEQLQRIFRLKRDLVTMRKIVTPQRDLFARGIDDIVNLPGLEPGTRDYFRDVYDHLIRISDLIDSYRDLLTGAMDVYLSTVSNRLNAIMKQLTIIATVFLPLTFVTGFFGQNFGWLVDHVDSLGAFLALGIGGVVVPIAALLAWFRRAGYL